MSNTLSRSFLYIFMVNNFAWLYLKIDMVPQRTTQTASRGEGTPELGESDRRVLDIPWRWHSVYSWSSPLY